MIPAKAVIDTLRPATPVGPGLFKVEVWGAPPHDYVRSYTVEAKSDNLAAQDALHRFGEEIATLLSEG
jgi:hypothetical protein